MGFNPKYLSSIVIILILIIINLINTTSVLAVYGDIILNEDRKFGMAPVRFPHWLHRIRFRCKVCHPAIFEMKKGANPITMSKIQGKQYCGACHNHEIVWGLRFDRCFWCHSVE